MEYKYNSICGANESKDNCGSDDLCHKSYPNGDPDKNNSLDYACRPVPQAYIENDFSYAKRESRSSAWGLCIYGCTNGCYNSWWTGANKKTTSSKMSRCKP